MQTIATLPRPLDGDRIARLRHLAEMHGVRAAAAAIRVSRHLFLVALAGLPLDDEQRAAVDTGLRTVATTEGSR